MAWRKIFNVAVRLKMEDGYDNEFTDLVEKEILEKGHDALKDLIYFIRWHNPSPDSCYFAFKTLGRMEDDKTHNQRRLLLELFLCMYPKSTSMMRDGAALGLASLADPASIVILKRAIKQEKVPELKEDLWAILLELQGE